MSCSSIDALSLPCQVLAVGVSGQLAAVRSLKEQSQSLSTSTREQLTSDAAAVTKRCDHVLDAIKVSRDIDK